MKLLFCTASSLEMKNLNGINVWMMRSNQLCDLGFSHTHICRGGGEGGREQGQPEQTRGKREKTTKQNKGKEGGKVGEGSAQEPNPGTQKSNQRNAKQATKKNTAGRQLKQGRGKRGWGGKRGEKEEEREGWEGERRVVSQAMREASMSPLGGKREGAPSYTEVSRPKVGGCNYQF